MVFHQVKGAYQLKNNKNNRIYSRLKNRKYKIYKSLKSRK